MYLIHLNQEETMAEIFSVLELELSTWLLCFRLEIDLGWDCLDMNNFYRAIQDHKFCKILHNPLLNYKRFSRNTSCSYSLCHLRGYPSTSLSQFWVHEYLLPRSMSRWENHICPIPLWYVLWNLEHVFKWKLPININGYQLLT